jgi:hypothetical protein
LLGISVVAGIAIAAPAAVATSAHAAAGKRESAKFISQPPPASPYSPFAGAVQQLGATRFATAYAGQVTSPSGHLIIYVVGGRGRAFLGSVRDEAARTGGGNYTVVYVQHSWAELNALTIRIARQFPHGRVDGISLGRWGPDPSFNKVLIELRSYSRAAERKLLARYGSAWISVSHVPFRQRMIFMDRYYDRAPFFGGDAIFVDASRPGTNCTSGFMVNNDGGSHFMTTAGHCGTRRPWYTNFFSKYILGNTSSNYFSNTTLDAQTIYGSGYYPAVYGNSTRVYYPQSVTFPQLHAGVTVDGARTGEVNGATVTRVGPFCVNVPPTVCYLQEASDSSQVVVQGGDSGGPVFVRTTSDSNVSAAGTISLGSPDGHIVDYVLMTYIQSVGDVTLATGGSGRAGGHPRK